MVRLTILTTEYRLISMMIEKLSPQIQPYEWGDRFWLQRFLNRPEAAGRESWAELWLGVHPKGMSYVALPNGDSVALKDYIAQNPEGVLGHYGVEQYQGNLPFLFKILAIAAPLSIQCHPTKEQAETGFSHEESLHIPVDAPDRNYKDANHKPEIVCAVTPFTAMCGFRAMDEIVSLFRHYTPAVYDDLFHGALESSDMQLEDKYRFLLKRIMRLSGEERARCMEGLHRQVPSLDDSAIEARLLRRFLSFYPEDPSVLAPLYLNIIQLQPGEALYQPAGELHAYVEGVGIELMANSDNVLRGGLTPKHVDVDELMRVVRFEPVDKHKTLAESDRFGRSVYYAPADDFILRKLDNGPYAVAGRSSVEIFIQLEGTSVIKYRDPDTGEECVYKAGSGESWLIPAGITDYLVDCSGLAFAAGLPSGRKGT